MKPPRLVVALAAFLLAALLWWTAYPWIETFFGTCSGAKAIWPGAARQAAVLAISALMIAAGLAAAFVGTRAARRATTRADLIVVGVALAVLLIELTAQPVDRLGVDAAYTCLTRN